MPYFEAAQRSQRTGEPARGGAEFNTSHLIVVVVVSLLAFCSLTRADDVPDEVLSAKRLISGAMLLSHIEFLASDYCRGREPGDQGMAVAAKYLTSTLKGTGVKPAGDRGYLQPVPMEQQILDKRSAFEVIVEQDGYRSRYQADLDLDFLPISISAQKEVTAPVVFAGYGITSEEPAYDDYARLDARGKVVLVMRHEPRENDADSPFDGKRRSPHATLLSKILNAQQHGAVGVLFVTDPLNHELQTPSTVGGTHWPTLEQERYGDDDDSKLVKLHLRHRIIGDDFGVRIPAAAIDGKLAGELLGPDHSLLLLQETIDRNLAPQSFALPGTTVKLGVRFERKPVGAGNILAMVEGSEFDLKNEVVVVGAHYDHEGKDNRGQVYPGADDNASGTAAVLELARAFQRLEHKPSRSILFVLFTAEEKSLLGSRFFIQEPPVPLSRITAVINMDMIGRNAMDQLVLVGKQENPKLFEIIDRVNSGSSNFEINLSADTAIRSSDQFPFLRSGIPAVGISSGLHDQYHEPEDTAGLIVVDKIEKVTQLVFLSLWEIANLPAGTSLRSEQPEAGPET